MIRCETASGMLEVSGLRPITSQVQVGTAVTWRSEDGGNREGWKKGGGGHGCQHAHACIPARRSEGEARGRADVLRSMYSTQVAMFSSSGSSERSSMCDEKSCEHGTPDRVRSRWWLAIVGHFGGRRVMVKEVTVISVAWRIMAG